MYITPISMTRFNKPNFCANSSENTNRPITLEDLYNMEDRIQDNNVRLIKKQNKLIGEALEQMTNLIYLAPCTDNISDIDKTYETSKQKDVLLANNGVIKIQHSNKIYVI